VHPRIWSGWLLDGKTAGRQAAEIHVSGEGLDIRTAAGSSWWPFEELRLTQGRYGHEPVRLERGAPLPETLVIGDPAFLACLHETAPGPTRRLHDPVARRFRGPLIWLAAAAIPAIGAAVYLWLIPWVVDRVAPHIPLEWERGLGQSALQVLAPEDSRCRDPELTRAVDRIAGRLSDAEPGEPPFQVILVNHDAVNAFALPGGSVVVTRGLLEETASPEELAGVIAHELQHVRLRHVTRRILSGLGTGMLVRVLTRGADGLADHGALIAHELAALRHSRADELEADARGLRMCVAAGVDPEAMIGFYENSLGRLESRGLPAFAYSHPDMSERVARLRAIARALPAGPPRTPLLEDGANWTSLRARCGDPR